MKYTRKPKSNMLKPFTNVKIIAFFAVILIAIAIPVTIGLQNQPTQNRSNATAATTLSFSQSSVQANIGDPINLDVDVNPGTNLVSFIDLVVDYDSSIVTPVSPSFTTNTTAFPQVLDGPINTCTGSQCTLEIQLSIGSDPTRAITTTTKVGTVSFQAIANGTMQLGFDNQTSILSLGSNDRPNENVLSSSTPSTITVGNGQGNTPIPTNGNISPTNTPIPTSGGSTPTPTPTGNGNGGTCNDKTEKLREKIEDLREKNEALREKLETIREEKNKSNSGSSKTNNGNTVNGKAQGACMGSFDPNNPNFTTNCNPTNTHNSSWWSNITNFFQNLFGSSSQ